MLQFFMIIILLEVVYLDCLLILTHILHFSLPFFPIFLALIECFSASNIAAFDFLEVLIDSIFFSQSY